MSASPAVIGCDYDAQESTGLVDVAVPAGANAETVLMVSPLANSSSPELRRLTVLETEECVIVSGRVSSFYMKQLALEAVLAKANGRRIENRVEVSQK